MGFGWLRSADVVEGEDKLDQEDEGKEVDDLELGLDDDGLVDGGEAD